jgi:predicted nucleic acid-binding protein
MAGASNHIKRKGRFVLDCSVVLSWCFPDERSTNSERFLSMLAKAKTTVPALWFLELSNALIVGERRKRLSSTETTEVLQLLSKLPIEVDERSGFPFAANVLTLARRHGLSAYDAAYLELAQRLALPIATLDRRLQTAAKAAGINLYVP